MADVEQYRLAAISTSHLEQGTAEDMERRRDWDFPVAVFPEGFFVSCSRVPDVMPADEQYPSLWAVRQWAQQNRFQYVLLDRDAGTVEDLPAYDW